MEPLSPGLILTNHSAKLFLTEALKRLKCDESLIDELVHKTIFRRGERFNGGGLDAFTLGFCVGFSSALDARDCFTAATLRQDL